MKNVSLKSRIILSLVIIVTATSSLFAFGLLYIKAELESVIFGRMVEEQLGVILDQLERGDFREDNLVKHWNFYSGDEITTLPQEIRQLEPGSHHSVIANNHFYQVQVGNWQGEPVYLSYDITSWEDQEHEVLKMLVMGIALVMVVAIILGRHASRVILAPVNALTQRLAKISPNQRNTRIADEFAGNEIGQIATAFDQYLSRLDQFVMREQSFTAAASHELRTPLAVMVGAADVLEANSQDPVVARATARIKRACEEMQAFIQAALFLSREESNTITPDGGCDLKATLEELIEDYRPQLNTQNIQLHTSVEKPPFLSEPASIVQITLSNLLRNAIEHSPGGTIHIGVQGATLVMADSGEGIPAQDLPHIFELNYTTKASGNGMGLNLVRRICDRFGWHISVASEPGSGTTITLNFRPTATQPLT